MAHPTSPSPATDLPRGPVRTCVGCRQRAAKRELVRVTVGSDPHGHPVVVPDLDATAPGRGAHLHPTTECLELATRRRAFARALRLSGTRARELSTAPLAAHLDGPQDQRQHQQQDRPAPRISTTTAPTRNWSSSS